MRFLALLALLPSLPLFASTQIPLAYVYRDDARPDDGRRVVFQGAAEPSAALSNFCGLHGEKCNCVFTAPEGNFTSSQLMLSRTYNYVQCLIPGSVDPDNFSTARLEQKKDSRVASSSIAIKTSLVLKDVIGSLDPKDATGVFAYSCTHTFLEGEGVSSFSVDCHPSQRLGLIQANYSYYLHRNSRSGNFEEKGSSALFPSPICDKQIERFTCTNNTPELRWGLMRTNARPFVAGITLASNPESSQAPAVYGYAALPDESGGCPPGMAKVRPFVAQPSSIIAGELDGKNPPSNFINSFNNLNNTRVEEGQPTNFQVMRFENSTPCASSASVSPAPGSCKDATFATGKIVQNVTYTQVSPVVCVIRKELLNNL